MQEIFAHVKWFENDMFVEHQPRLEFGEWLIAGLILFIGLAVLRLIGKWLSANKFDKKLDARFKPIRNYVPTVVRLSTAGFLLVNFINGYLLAPNVTADHSYIAGLIGYLFLTSAIILILGLYTDLAAYLLATGWLLVFFKTSPVDVLEHFEYIAIAGYLLFRGPGRYSLDRYLKIPGKYSLNKKLRYASLNFYRVGIGIGLVVLAFSEKLANLTLAQGFLDEHHWNLLAQAGATDRNFILIAGTIELILGLALILNFASRLVVLVILGTMILTAAVLGVNEVYGHLFAVGLVVAILVNDKQPNITSS
ncbi:hypothetical protein KC878_02200 [Candidatus Saccharibacteria bacterium]|nr:hypothetical protein [Candidatus Saccharibacteria bacterium]MCB9820991.1 hypothetical protein [Candidatus Nomurabacteria bacterium]